MSSNEGSQQLHDKMSDQKNGGGDGDLLLKAPNLIHVRASYKNSIVRSQQGFIIITKMD